MTEHILIKDDKTFIMSLIAHYLSDKKQGKGAKVELYSNYELKDSKPMKEYEVHYDTKKAQPSILCWNMICDFEIDRKKKEKLLYSRPMNSMNIYCSSSIKDIDSFLKQIIEILIDVEEIKNEGYQLQVSDFQSGEQVNTCFISYKEIVEYVTKKSNHIDSFDLLISNESGDM